MSELSVAVALSSQRVQENTKSIIMIIEMVMMIIMVEVELNMLLLSSTKQAQSLSYDAKTPVTQA